MKTPLSPYPADWQQVLNIFEPEFTAPQFGNFCQVATCMATSNSTSVCRWSQAYCPKHQSTLNDFFTQPPWDDAGVRTRLHCLIGRRVRDRRAGVFDDTFAHKPYAEKMDHLGWFHDGLSKEVQWGHNIVTCGLQSHDLGFVPFDEELVIKGDGRTKSDIACVMIDEMNRRASVPVFVFDAWYSNQQVIGRIHDRGKRFVTEIKSNRKVTIQHKSRWAREHARLLRMSDFKEADIGDERYRYAQTDAFISKIGTVNLVFSQRYEHGRWSDMHYLITDIRGLCGERVIETYLLRGGIEGFHRESKQHLGFEHYHLRNGRGIARYLFLILLTYVLLCLVNQAHLRKTLDGKTIGGLCEELKAGCITNLFEHARDHGGIGQKAEMIAYAL